MTEDVLQDAAAPPRTPLQESWRILRRNRLAMVGLAFFAAFFLLAVLGVILTSGRQPIMDPSAVRLSEKFRPPLSRWNRTEVEAEGAPAPPFGIYVLGTDSLGRDVLSRMLQGAWVSLTIGFVAVGISVFIGIVLGGLAGYFDDWPSGPVARAAAVLFASAVGVLLVVVLGLQSRDYLTALRNAYVVGAPIAILMLLLARLTTPATVIMRFVDLMLCIPRFFLILTVIALAEGGIFKIMLVVGLTSWMGTTRFVRAEFLSLRKQDFVSAARALGVGDFRIIFRHMIPNAVAPVLVSATLGIAGTILLEAGLSFLGFGVPPPHATWGKILADGKSYIFDAPWLTFAPGFAILVVVLSFNLFGEGLRDAFNPKLRDRGA